jgi:hypothetical protein
MQDEAYAQCEGAYDWAVTGAQLSVAIGQVAAQKRVH